MCSLNLPTSRLSLIVPSPFGTFIGCHICTSRVIPAADFCQRFGSRLNRRELSIQIGMS